MTVLLLLLLPMVPTAAAAALPDPMLGANVVRKGARSGLQGFGFLCRGWLMRASSWTESLGRMSVAMPWCKMGLWRARANASRMRLRIKGERRCSAALPSGLMSTSAIASQSSAVRKHTFISPTAASTLFCRQNGQRVSGRDSRRNVPPPPRVATYGREGGLDAAHGLLMEKGEQERGDVVGVKVLDPGSHIDRAHTHRLCPGEHVRQSEGGDDIYR